MMRRIFTTGDEQNTQYILEKEHGFQVCVHNKNFIAGVPIATSITNAVKFSRRVIVLLTEYVLILSSFIVLILSSFISHSKGVSIIMAGMVDKLEGVRNRVMKSGNQPKGWMTFSFY